MRIRFYRMLVPAGLLVLAAGCQGKVGGLATKQTPIIVGDGSIHIRSENAPFLDKKGHWDKQDKKTWKRKDNGRNGTYSKVLLVGYNDGGWSKPIEIKDGEIFDFSSDSKNEKCEVVMCFAPPGGDPKECITVECDGSKKGMEISPSSGDMTGYKPDPADTDQKELVRNLPYQLWQVEVCDKKSGSAKVAWDKAKIDCLCPRGTGPGKYLGCGVKIELAYDEP